MLPRGKVAWVWAALLVVALALMLMLDRSSERPTPQAKRPSMLDSEGSLPVEAERPPPERLVTPALPERALPAEPVGEEEPIATDEPEETAVDGALEVVLFELGLSDENHPGQTWSVGLGLTNAGPLTFPSKAPQAIEVPAPWQVTLFENEDALGERIVLGPGRHDLRSYRFHGRTSSLRVTRVGQSLDAPNGPPDAVLLYEHSNAYDDSLGASWELRLGARRTRLFTSHEGHFEAQSISSAWVPFGYELTVFENPAGFGRALVLGPGFHELDPMEFNDVMTSARVRRTH